MASKRKGTSKQLRQATLFESPKASSRTCSSKSSLQTGFKRKPKTHISETDAGSDNDDDYKGIGSIKFAPKASGSSDDDAVVARAPKRRKTVVVDSDGSERVVRQRKSRKKKTVSCDADADEAAEQPRRRKLKKKRDVALVSSTDEEELAEEVDKERIIESRLRNRNKKSVFQRNLEKLKRRKQGKPSDSSSSSHSEESASSEDDDLPFKGAKPSSDFDSLFDDNSDSSDFIVEDDNSVVATLPMEFSMASHDDLDHQFKKIFQFFVHIAVRPAKERHHFMEEQLYKERYFSMPLQTVRRKLSGLRDSLVSSSVWRPDFKKALATYPVFDLVPLDFAVPSCDACHLGGRMSTLIGRLSGSSYDSLGFEFKDKDYSGHSDSDESDDDDMSSKNEKVAAEFHLGRFCARRTRVYHQFTHWEYALFKCIRDEVDELHENRQSRGFFRIAYAGGIGPPEDLDDADGICDWLDQRKVIDMEWMKIKEMMESARHLELDKKKGEDD